MEGRDETWAGAGEEPPPSSYNVLQQISEGAVKVAGEALQSVYSSGSSPLGSGHRRSQSELGNGLHKRSNSFQRFRSQVQKAWQWGNSFRDERNLSSFNPEILANQKRQWYQLNSKTSEHKKYEKPSSLFEHFIVAGLPSDVNLDIVEDAFAKRKKWELDMARADITDLKMLRLQEPSLPTLEPQILFKYPPGKKSALRSKDLAAFCFPSGVRARLLERSPSLSDLNELVYGQDHLARDDSAFVFSLKVADNATMYGVCLHVSEIVQRPPGITGVSSPLSQPPEGCSRFLVSAPRCYCVLTRVPFFELHYEMLNSIIAQERLNRITEFVSEIALNDFFPSASKQEDQTSGNSKSPDNEYYDWMASAIPLDSTIALTAAAAGMISDDEICTSRSSDSHSPSHVKTSEATALSQAMEMGADDRRNMPCCDDFAAETFGTQSISLEQTYRGYGNGHNSPQNRTLSFSRIQTMERVGSFGSLFSPVRSVGSEDDDDDLFPNDDISNLDDVVMGWARENKNDLLQIVCSYHAQPVPERGSVLVFHLLDHLQAVEYKRPSVSYLCLCEKHTKLQDPLEADRVCRKLAAAEEALALSIWTTATICRTLSLDNILAMFAGALLEKQIVVVCPNLGLLSALVLSLIPMIRPFSWQSLLLPVLPMKMLDFLDAPVPFIVGIEYKPADLKMKTSNLVHVNVLKDQVKSCQLPSLPRRKELVSKLKPLHARLLGENSRARKHPVYNCNEVQAEAAAQFLAVMRWYLESLCLDLRSHTITNVQSNQDKVSILLKETFIDSFSWRDRPFMKLFVDTQLFTVLLDSRLSSFELE